MICNRRRGRLQCRVTWLCSRWLTVCALIHMCILAGLLRYKTSSYDLQYVQYNAIDEVGKGQKKVILAAYYRSGSTLVSDLVELDNGTFSLCEPFYSLYAHLYGAAGYHEVFFTADGSKRVLPEVERLMLAVMLAEMTSCRFSRLPHEFFLNRFLWEYPTSPLPSLYLQCAKLANVTKVTLKNCLKHTIDLCPSDIYMNSDAARVCYTAKQAAVNNQSVYGAAAYVRRHVTAYSQCVDDVWKRLAHCTSLLESECRAAKTVLIKNIRLDLDLIDMVVERDPRVKVVHLVRDPRAMMHSRQKWVPVTKEEVLATCARLHHDVKSAKRLISSKPGNYLQVRYEDVVNNPIDYAGELYRHLSITPPKSLSTWVTSHFHAKADNAAFGTVRKNSSEHVTLWRTNQNLVNLFSQTESDDCTAVFQQLHYDAYYS